jgi:hypothetical protein
METIRFDDITDHADVLAQKIIAGAREYGPAELRLDERSFGFAMVGDDYIAIRIGDRPRCDYYAGFEYVDKDEIVVLGPWVFYGARDGRISEILERLADEEGTDGQEQ